MKRFTGISLLALFMPVDALAHVKWFVDYDTTKEPVPLTEMMQSTEFLGLLFLSTLVIFITSVLDRKIPSPVDVSRWQPRLTSLEDLVPKVMRYGTSAFFLTLAVFFPSIILTPELVIENPGLVYVHFLIAITAFHQRTSLIAGVAIQLYGLFHMLDYLVFIGTGVYLIMQTLKPEVFRGLSLELVRFTLAYSFLWGAIEKFMHPELFHQLLTEHNYLTMGLDWSFFIRASGFVEFCCAWHIYSGRAAGYAGIGVMGFFVTVAVIPFGMIDFIGHFLFIIPLVAILFIPRKKPLCATATCNTFGFLFTLGLYMGISYATYYILHFYMHMHLFS
ncbi:hypothetical protein [Erwinia amylovora]|uniref:hypothetical protein n=1 Tax=Erwinia amylovora TaxID=552 RepID=UPI00295F4AB5|nr:hypothetical protein [Erwinia amylovora]